MKINIQSEIKGCEIIAEVEMSLEEAKFMYKEMGVDLITKDFANRINDFVNTVTDNVVSKYCELLEKFTNNVNNDFTNCNNDPNVKTEDVKSGTPPKSFDDIQF